ncbi:MAG: HmuY family protein [Myxococcota bacterium]
MRNAMCLMLGGISLSGCLMPSLADTLDPGPALDDGELAFSNGQAEFVVDATDRKVFVALDLDTLEYLEMDDPSWDLAFRRFEVALQDGLEAVILDGVAFDEVVEVPEGEWVTDQPDADDDGIPEYAFAEWYDYDFDNHTLAPADRTYVVRTTEDRTFKVGFQNYYDEAGTPARITMRIAELGP